MCNGFNTGFISLLKISNAMKIFLTKILSLLGIVFFANMRTMAQKGGSLAIATIPYKLFWENKPVGFSIHNNALTLTAGEKTDMFRDPNVAYNTDNAPKLLFKADDDFVFSASIEHAFTNKWDGGAIVIKSDSLNWIKFCFEKDYTGARRVVSVVTKNISDDCNSVEMKANKVFYKVAKAGNVITLYYSISGTKWFLIRHLQFDAKPGFLIGFLAQSPTGASCTVHFADIKYTQRKIKDPYTGE
jgi:regulation of enolase protein 1 (concanavalin A-like superfamily)